MGFEPHETVNAVFGGKAGDGSCFVLPNAARELEGRTDVDSPIRMRGEEIDERHRADRNMGPCLRRDPRFAATVDHKGRLTTPPGIFNRFSSTPGPCEGRDPSCNRSIAGEMGSCLRRNPELHLVSPLAPSDPLAVDGVLAADELDIGRATRIIDFERAAQGRDDFGRLADPLGVEAEGADHLRHIHLVGPQHPVGEGIVSRPPRSRGHSRQSRHS